MILVFECLQLPFPFFDIRCRLLQCVCQASVVVLKGQQFDLPFLCVCRGLCESQFKAIVFLFRSHCCLSYELSCHMFTQRVDSRNVIALRLRWMAVLQLNPSCRAVKSSWDCEKKPGPDSRGQVRDTGVRNEVRRGGTKMSRTYSAGLQMGQTLTALMTQGTMAKETTARTGH